MRIKQHKLTVMDTKYYSFAGIYLFTFGALGTLLPLLGQYLAGIGFSGVQIGVVTSTATAVGIGAAPFWGYRSHHSKDSSLVLIFICIATALIALGLSLVKPFLLFLLAYAAFSFFQTPIMPLTDAMTLENGLPYGAVRKWGAISFAAGVFIAGQLAYATGLAVIFPLCASGYAAGGFLIVRLKRAWQKGQPASEKRANPVQPDPACTFPDHRPETDRKERRGSYITLCRNKKLMALLFAAFFICGTNVANNIYFGFLYRDVGGSIAGVGIAFLLMCGAEAPFMAWAEKLEKVFSMEKMILIPLIISALRYLWYFTGPAPGLLLGTFFLQGLVNGIALVGLVRYVAKLVEADMIGMAMTFYTAVSSNCSTIVCQLIGGAVLDHSGPAQVYLFFSIYNALGILLYVGFRLYKCSD